MEKLQKERDKLIVDSTVFARPLEVVINRQKFRNIHLKIPEFIDNAIRALILKGITDGSLFAVTPTEKEHQEAVMTLRNQLNKGEPVDFTKSNAKVIAMLIRLFLKQLPEPLFPKAMITQGK